MSAPGPRQCLLNTQAQIQFSFKIQTSLVTFIRHKIKHLMCKCCSFENVNQKKPSIFSWIEKNRCFTSKSSNKKMLQNWKGSNSHAYCSFSVFLFWIQLCYFVCDFVHVIQEDGATTASTFFPFKASLGLPSTLLEVKLLVVGAKNQFMVLATFVQI